MAVSMQSAIFRKNTPVEAPVDDELVMLDVEAGKYYGFNSIAAAVWKKLDAKISVEELCRELCAEYDVSAEQCAADVLPFLNDLEKRNLIFVE